MAPRVLTPEVTEAIAAHVRSGASLTRAAGLCGVSPPVVSRWLAEGQRQMRREAEGERLDASEQAAADIARTFLRAQGEWAEKLLGVVRKDVESDGVGSAKWLLERQFPDEFGRRVQVDQVVSRELDKILDVARDTLAPESFNALLAALARAGFGDAPPAAAVAADDVAG